MVGMMARKKSILMNEPHLVSVSGHALNVENAEFAPLKSCTVGIEPLHPWGGDTGQTNGRTLDGWDSVKLYFSRKNIVPSDAVMVQSYFVDGSGIIVRTTTYKYCPQFIPVKPGTTYTVQCQKGSSTSSGITIPFYTSGKSFISRAVAVSGTTDTGLISGIFTTPSNAAYIHFSVGAANTNIQIEEGNMATAYEEPSAVAVSLGRTVYGGTLNVFTGTLTVDRVEKTIDNTVGLTQMTGITNKYFVADGFEPYGDVVDDDMISDIYVDDPTIAGANNNIGIRIWNRPSPEVVRFLVRPEGYNSYTTESYNAYLAENPFHIVYRLTTPITYAIDPQTIKSLRGHNIITTNVGGSLTASVWTH